MRKILPLRAWLAAGLILGSPFSHAASNLVYWAGSKPAGLPSEQKIRLLAKAWGTAATSAAPSSEGMIAERMTAFLRME